MAKVAYTAPGLLIADVEARIAAVLGMSVATAADLALIDQMITLAGQAATQWQGRVWWWARSTGDFDTVDTTKSYVLSTVNTADMADIYAPLAMWREDETRLVKIPKLQYDEWNNTLSTTGAPYHYALDGQTLTAHLWPTPDDAYTIYVSYMVRHSKITSAGSTDAALIVPPEFQWGVYIDGAVWLLRHEKTDPFELENCDAFVNTMTRMAAQNPDEYYDQESSDRNGSNDPSVPPDRRSWVNASPLTGPA